MVRISHLLQIVDKVLWGAFSNNLIYLYQERTHSWKNWRTVGLKSWCHHSLLMLLLIRRIKDMKGVCINWAVVASLREEEESRWWAIISVPKRCTWMVVTLLQERKRLNKGFQKRIEMQNGCAGMNWYWFICLHNTWFLQMAIQDHIM